jgi:hypothetical protein
MKLFAVIALLVLGACTDKIVVESNTTWVGYIGPTTGGTEYTGSNNQTFKAPSGNYCWSFSKTTDSGFLRAYLKGGFPNITATKDGDQTTTDPKGTVAGCKH